MHEQSSSTSKRKRCVIGGFMGTGKTTIGRLLSKKLDIPFLDMDEELTERWGEIHLQFKRDGEDVFRGRERSLALSLAASVEPIVIATGGGVFASLAQLEAFGAQATTISLTASFSTLSSRVQGGGDRPLWNADAEALFLTRGAAYACADFVVDTESRPLEEVVEELFHIMNRV